MPGGRIFVRRWTPAALVADTPLILMHDSLGSVELWREFPELLAGRLCRPIIAYDRLGYGRSSERGGPATTNLMHEEAEVYFPAVREALGLHDFAIMGHSIGGGMSLMIAGRIHDACRAVISESAQAFIEPRTLDAVRAGRDQFRQPDQLDRLKRYHGDKAQWVLDAWTEVWLSPALAGWSLQPELPKVKCPTLVIHGDRDEFGSVAFPEAIARGVAGPVRKLVFGGCGHIPHREMPETVLECVAQFLCR